MRCFASDRSEESQRRRRCQKSIWINPPPPPPGDPARPPPSSSSPTHPRRTQPPVRGCAIPQSLQPLPGGEIDRRLTIDFSAGCQELQSCYAGFTDFPSFNTCNRVFDIARRADCAEQGDIRVLFCIAALSIYSFGLENFGWPIYIYRQWIHSPASLP